MPSALRFHLPVDIRFGRGRIAELPSIVRELGSRRVLLLTDPGLRRAGIVDRVAGDIGVPFEVEDRVPGNPTASDVAQILADARAFAPEAILALGGGSPIDVAKVLALLLTNPGSLEEYQWGARPVERPVLPVVAVPTTAGTGAEVSRAAVIVDRGQKQGIARDALFPRVAIVDPELTRSVPPHLTAATGFDAFAHAAEALVARGATPFSQPWALTAAQMIFRSLPRAMSDGSDMEAREELSLAATMAGAAMAHAGLGIIHAIASPLGGHFNIHHGLTNALLLPAALEFNRSAAAAAYERLARSIGYQGTGDREAALDWLVDAVESLVRQTGIAFDLTPYGIGVQDIEELARESADNWMARTNPRPVQPEDCARILRSLLPE